MAEFGQAGGGSARGRARAKKDYAPRPVQSAAWGHCNPLPSIRLLFCLALYRFEFFFLHLAHQALELLLFQADGVLSVAGVLPGDVPVGHPAELFAFGVLQHDQERIERDLFLFFPEPRFELFGQEGGNDLEVTIAGSKLKIEIDVQVAGASAGGTRFGSDAGEIVEGVEQFLVGRILLMTLIAKEKWRSHDGPTFPEGRLYGVGTAPGLRFDCRFIHQHDGEAILNRIDPAALCAFQAFRVFTVFQRLYAGRTNQVFQQIFTKHDVGIVRQGRNQDL
jgi:hypothetical protein